MQIDHLRTLPLEGLEEVYRRERVAGMPRGRFRGVHLASLPWPKEQGRLMRLACWLGFEKSRFGVDFDARRWFFVREEMLVGHFSPTVGPSRWRDTETVRLDYAVSRLPGFVRSKLYDEVKPLSEKLCLGLGGVDAPRGRGELFFFALERISL